LVTSIAMMPNAGISRHAQSEAAGMVGLNAIVRISIYLTRLISLVA